jgi:hypothetical protein
MEFVCSSLWWTAGLICMLLESVMKYKILKKWLDFEKYCIAKFKMAAILQILQIIILYFCVSFYFFHCGARRSSFEYFLQIGLISPNFIKCFE